MSDVLWNRVDAGERQIVEGFLEATPVRVSEIAAALGIDVLRTPLPPKISGLIQPSEKSKSGFEIKVNKYEILERQRFTVAHEIAHYLLHRAVIGSGVVDSVLYRSALTSKKEAEANRLAAEIVMPEAAVSSALRDYGLRRDENAVETLSSIFRVSAPAMRIRLGLA